MFFFQKGYITACFSDIENQGQAGLDEYSWSCHVTIEPNF